jgi:SM-20-related protein
MNDLIFRTNPGLDLHALAHEFAAAGRVQVRDVLSKETAMVLTDMLQQDTGWGIAWQAGAEGPHYTNAKAVHEGGAAKLGHIQSSTYSSVAGNDYGFQFGSYPILQAYLEKWNPGSLQDAMLEHINDTPFLNIVKHITGFSDLKKADAQATLYAPGHFLAAHDDSHVGQSWKVAYVLNLCPVEWRPDWGGYLNFLNEDGDVIAGWRPRFNCLNLFLVPQLHHVTFVPPFAPAARFAITGWFRDQ